VQHFKNETAPIPQASKTNFRRMQEWQLISGPSIAGTSGANIVGPADGPSVTVSNGIAGQYEIGLATIDENGCQAECGMIINVIMKNPGPPASAQSIVYSNGNSDPRI